MESGSEQRSPRLLPFEVPSQGTSPWHNRQSKPAYDAGLIDEKKAAGQRPDRDVRNGREMVAELTAKKREEPASLSMVGATLPAAPSVRIAKSRQFSMGLINKGSKKDMKVELIIPIDSLRGKLRQDGFYFRKYRGQQIVQKCPDRSKHVFFCPTLEYVIFLL